MELTEHRVTKCGHAECQLRADDIMVPNRRPFSASHCLQDALNVFSRPPGVLDRRGEREKRYGLSAES
jgi:hypothetical protein